MTALGTPTKSARRVQDFEVIGDRAGPVVVVLGGISATAHVVSHPADPTPGWWQGIAGPGGALDPARCCLVGVEYIVTTGRTVTSHDQARVVAQVLDQLGVDRAHALVGASYGGMVALAFAELFPARVRQLVVLCAAHCSDPMTTALRLVQRRILRLAVAAGRDREGLELARALGVITYRTAAEFAVRFGGDGAKSAAAVEAYLDHQGQRFATRFSVERYLALSESLDRHRVEPERIPLPVTLVGNREDAIVPLRQLRQLAARLPGPVRLHLLDSPTGHDAFLTETEAVSRILSDTLALEDSDVTSS